MRGLRSRVAAIGSGFVRGALLAAVSFAIPALSLAPAFAAAMLGSAWSWVNPWSWVGLVAFFVPLVLVFARPVGAVSRRLVTRWVGLPIEDGYRGTAPEPVRLSTGYWWNGYSYERSRRDALMDQRWRHRLGDPAYWRDVRWVPIAAVTVGPVCAVPVALIVGAVFAFAQQTAGLIAAGVVLLVLAVALAPYAWRAAVPLAQRCLRLPKSARMAGRVRELELQRANLTTAQVAEIHRIERDLHDGAQARLVAVGLSLATAEKLMEADPARARALLREARDGTSNSLADLRNLVRGISPPVLVERGLVDAIRALVLDSPVQVSFQGPDRISLDTPIEAALYFAVAELLANAAKHAPSAHVTVSIGDYGDRIEAAVIDDGPGGAAMSPGGGLDGIRRRLAAFDATVTLTSPAGGPTRATIVVPCVSS